MHRTARLFALSIVSTLTFASSALAEDRVHDGFYIRLALGMSGVDTQLSTARARDPELGSSGVAGAFDLLLGGSPMPGLAIGGALMSDIAFGTTVDIDGAQQATGYDSSYAFIGPFIDGYIDPRAGLHFGGAVGFAGYTLDADGEADDAGTTYDGIGTALWAGYDVWIGAEWSLGGMLRFSAARGAHEVEIAGQAVNQEAITLAAALMFTALYN